MKRLYKTQVDIFEEICEETGYSYRMVKDSYFAWVHMLSKKINESEATAVTIPHVGTLYFKLNRESRKAINSHSRAAYKEHYEEKVKTINELTKKYPDKINAHRDTNLFAKYSYGYTMDQMEELQYMNYEKRLKDHEEDYR